MTAQSFSDRFATRSFPARKLPEAGKDSLAVAPPEKPFAVVPDHRQRPCDVPETTGTRRRAHTTSRGGEATLDRNRARRATRPARHADRRAQVHESLIEIPRAAPRNEAPRGAAQGALTADLQRPPEDAPGVAVEGWNRAVEGDAGDRGRRVVADAGQGAERCVFGRQLSRKAAADFPGRPAEIFGAAIIAQAGPESQDPAGRGATERGEIGQHSKETLVIRHHGRDLGLLQHGLGNPDGVRVPRAAPRKVASGSIVPSQELQAKLEGQRLRHSCGQTAFGGTGTLNENSREHEPATSCGRRS